MLRFLSIVFLGIAAAIFYGLVHDQVTIRISLEYFTILHPPILPDGTSPTLLALAWGVLATWWVGLILGVILAVASCAGSRPKLSPRSLIHPIFMLLLVMACGAALAGFTGYLLTIHHVISPSAELLAMLPRDKVVGAITDGFSHLTSYALGFIGGIVLAVRAWIRRGKLQLSPSQLPAS